MAKPTKSNIRNRVARIRADAASGEDLARRWRAQTPRDARTLAEAFKNIRRWAEHAEAVLERGS